jgi:nitroreductase
VCSEIILVIGGAQVDAILSRRSIRAFKSAQVPDDLLLRIIKCGFAAPSAGNQQPWHFVVLRERRVLDELAAQIPEMQTATAPLAVLICSVPRDLKWPQYWPIDCALASENILIAAHAEGLGAVFANVYLKPERASIIRSLIPLPQEAEPFVLIPIGYPAEIKPPADRFDPAKVHDGKW